VSVVAAAAAVAEDAAAINFRWFWRSDFFFDCGRRSVVPHSINRLPAKSGLVTGLTTAKYSLT
jgi:hypothetical protein